MKKDQNYPAITNKTNVLWIHLFNALRSFQVVAVLIIMNVFQTNVFSMIKSNNAEDMDLTRNARMIINALLVTFVIQKHRNAQNKSSRDSPVNEIMIALIQTSVQMDNV